MGIGRMTDVWGCVRVLEGSAAKAPGRRVTRPGVFVFLQVGPDHHVARLCAAIEESSPWRA